VITFTVLAAITVSGVDSDGDVPGIIRLFVIALSVATWSLIFSVCMVFYTIRKKRLQLLALFAVLLIARIIFFCEPWGVHSESYYYLWMPFEYLVVYFTIHEDNLTKKLTFALTNAVLYGLCFLVFGKVLWLL
jgi:hypothetical protein